jgi:cytosine deaminase
MESTRPARDAALDDLSARLGALSMRPTDDADEAIGLVVCREALTAARQGNYGVGAVLLDPDGQVVGRGGNQVFQPYFRSDRHAEMVVMTAFERRHPEVGNLSGHTLMCSLEPCPMCLARVLTAGVGTVKFLADDANGGMVHRLPQLSVAWTRLAQGRRFEPAAVSPDLRHFAVDVVETTAAACRDKLLARGMALPPPPKRTPPPSAPAIHRPEP